MQDNREVNAVLAWLKAAFVEVLRMCNGFGHFDHRKLVLADGDVAWTGGRNFTAASFFTYHDLSYTLRGPLVAEMVPTLRGSVALTRAATSPAAREPAPPCAANARARVVGTGRCERSLAAAVYKALDRAGHHVYLENPYFTDSQLWCKLARARQRGADVRVVLALDSDSKVLDRALKVATNRLLKAGIRVYRYPGTTHVKAVSVDGCWAYFGTGNFDSLSFRRNCEVGLAVCAGPLIAELEEKLFLEDFRPEWEVTEPLPVTLGDYACELLATLLL